MDQWSKNEEWAGDSLDSRYAISGYRLLKAVNDGPSISVSKSWLYVRHIVPGVLKCGERRFMVHGALK